MKIAPVSKKPASETPVLHRLRRVRGQVDGIMEMINNERDCLDVIQQILAARNALSRAGKEYLAHEAVKCSSSASKKQSFDAILQKLFAI
ncbi:MAG: hypothetical protein UX04_C0004G0038 [Microgenomates group bacterium GW2011_GWF2_45_18]|nr:MAG: hypothetical protein UW18_C0004G0038 [Microgenomates group bacterium GW2011_GWF1_44_10]KKU01694.1 MAG: hypothetical protein UX04_C0004G0038 [Microgenomates group bacterium GW2011_GWF2_45_18]OGJ41533.1 MAG: hypothetical protein A2378_00345 [Candidatus Pacebacteria bacterium RIFOXYB1_FULL_44_10]